MLTIDRSRPFRLDQIESLAHAASLYAAPEHDDASLRLASIDADEVQLIPLDKASARGATTGSNQPFAEKLARLQEDGCVFLDAAALAALLRHPSGIPGHWRNVFGTSGTSSTSGTSGSGTTAGASIRFYGSRFALLETGDLHVLALSLDGERWVVELEPVGADGRAGYAALVSGAKESAWASGD